MSNPIVANPGAATSEVALPVAASSGLHPHAAEAQAHFEHAGAHGDGHGLLHHHFEDLEQQRESTNLGMWSFLSTEVMMFGGLFFVYTLYRHLAAGAAHVAGGSDPFATGGHMLNVPLGTANTFVLLFSSLTMAMAVHAAQLKNRKSLLIFMALTAILGTAFLVIKGFEWHADYEEGLVPGLRWEPEEALNHKGYTTGSSPMSFGSEMGSTMNTQVIGNSGAAMTASGEGAKFKSVNNDHLQMYFIIYFCMTGLHALHMVIGLGILGTLAFMGSKGSFTNGNDQPIELFGLYWHFVDIVWVFLFPLLYLIGGFSLGGLSGGH